MLLLPPPSTLLTLLQYHCTINAQYATPHPTPLCMPYTIQYWQWQYCVKAISQHCLRGQQTMRHEVTQAWRAVHQSQGTSVCGDRRLVLEVALQRGLPPQKELALRMVLLLYYYYHETNPTTNTYHSTTITRITIIIGANPKM